MVRYVAFLRAINVGGHTVKMDVLRARFESLGCARVETFIASGNVIFEAQGATAPLERRIEADLLDALGYEVATFIRTDAEVAAIARYRPFPAAAMESAGALNVGLLARPLTAAGGSELRRFGTDVDDFHLPGREVYWLCRLKQSESKFTNVSFEKSLGVRATFRGINTMRKLAAKYPPAGRRARSEEP